jgi:hypothetical protein
MSCKYIALYGTDNFPVGLCDRPCAGEYCVEHKRMMDAVDELDRELQLRVRERRI